MNTPKTQFWTCFLGGAVFLASLSLAYAKSAYTENNIKAGFVFNFIKFVEWPTESFANSDEAIRVCIWGNNVLDGALNTLNEKTAQNRSIVILYKKRNVAEATHCHVLFIPSSHNEAYGKVISEVGSKNILTISDTRKFPKVGGIIGLFRVGDRMRFAINVEAAKRSGLKFDSKILKIGEIVTQGEK